MIVRFSTEPNDSLLILSAHYGILKPLDLIKPYRLDYKMDIPDINLKKFWREKINNCLGSDTVVNLTSTEFSSIVSKNMINIEFKENRSGKYRVIATYAKMARGSMLRSITKNRISTLPQLKDIVVNDYCYNGKLSSSNKFVYIKNL